MRHVARQSKILPRRPAFTLVELLVVMGVLAMMSSLVLVGLASAAEQARVARTRSQVQKIHELLMTRWEDYRYRRVEALESSDTTGLTSTQRVLLKHRYRVDKIRQLMRMEMPCHKEDVLFDATDQVANAGEESLARNAGAPALWRRYRRTVASRTGDIANWTTPYDDAECLYMILESIQDGETNGLDFFKPSEIGDLDGDGMPEILDGWGRPIRFLRWAPGYRGVRSNLHRMDSPDPFDPLNVRDGRSQDGSGNFLHFPLYPLVFSAGPDEVPDIVLRFKITTDPQSMNHAINPGAGKVKNDPYYIFHDTDTSEDLQFGMEYDANGNGIAEYLDNISNHQLVIAGNDP